MAFLLPAARNLLPKLKSLNNNNNPLTPKMVPFLSASFEAKSSKVGNFLVQKCGFHIKVVGEEGSDEEKKEEESEADDHHQLMATVKRKIFDDPLFSVPFDCLTRNTMRVFFTNKVDRLCTFHNLLGKNLVWLQLVLIDESRDIQMKVTEYSFKESNDADVAERSRIMFKVIAPYLLHDTNRWVFSRSLVLKNYNGVFDDDEALEFASHDPVGGLKDVPFDMPLDTPYNEVLKNQECLTIKAVEAFLARPFDMLMPLGIRCSEVFMIIAGDYAVENEGLNSREAILKLLHELNTTEGMLKIHRLHFVSGSAKVSPEMLAVIKDLHLTA